MAQHGPATTAGLGHGFGLPIGCTEQPTWTASRIDPGQRYRFRLAKLIESGADVWIADEFLAVLDRTTAKVIAFNLQKIARRQMATVLVATTHTDMTADLAPNLIIEKRYREKISLVRVPEGYRESTPENAQGLPQ